MTLLCIKGLIENNKEVSSQVGEIQLTDYGVSGICVFCLSGRAARGLSEGKKEQIQINFLHPFKINNQEAFLCHPTPYCLIY